MINGFPPIAPLMPEIVMIVAALLVLMLDLVLKEKESLAGIGIAASMGAIYMLTRSMGESFGGMFVADGYSLFFKLIFLVTLILSILISIRYVQIVKINFGEYYALMILATVGMMVMASAGDLIVLYVGLELMAMSTYVLAGFMRQDRRSNEAALKYFLLGAFASAMLLYGISLTYGLTGTTSIEGIALVLGANAGFKSPALMMAILLYVTAFGFKVAAAPFHMWAPDVYEGAPTSVTAFMSVGPKAAGFAAMGRVFLIAFGSLQADWSAVLIPVAILTMAVGNIVALAQTNIKRMLAYSSIAHAGYLIVGLVAGTPEGAAGMMNYLMIYACMNIGAFAIVILLKSDGISGENLSDYEGLSKTHPVLAALMLVFMFSLTGIPPTAGFMGKFFLFMPAIEAGYTWLVVVAVIFSAISAYYYLRVVMYMYMREPQFDVPVSAAMPINAAVLIALIGVIGLGVMPENLFNMAREAIRSFGI